MTVTIKEVCRYDMAWLSSCVTLDERSTDRGIKSFLFPAIEDVMMMMTHAVSLSLPLPVSHDFRDEGTRGIRKGRAAGGGAEQRCFRESLRDASFIHSVGNGKCETRHSTAGSPHFYTAT